MLSRTLRTLIPRAKPTSILFHRANSSSRPLRPDAKSNPTASKVEHAQSFNDPFPLPFSDSLHGKEGTVNEDSLPPPRIPRGDESVQTLKARLVYQSRKRGTLETDLLLSTFAGEFLDGMSVEEMKEFDKASQLNIDGILRWSLILSMYA